MQELSLSDIKIVIKLKNEWIQVIAWDCHMENQSDNPLILGSNKMVNIKNCIFCQGNGDNDIHIHAVCEKLMYLEDIFFKILK